MEITILKRIGLPILWVTGATALFASLYMLSTTTQNSEEFDRLHVWLIFFNIAGVLTLMTLIGVNLFRLIMQYRNHVPGSRLTARLMAIFVLLAVAPVVFVFYFSIQFISRGIDSWFDVGVESAMANSLELSRTALDVRMRELLSRTERMAFDLTDTPDSIIGARLDVMRLESGATELTVFGSSRRIISTSAIHTFSIVPEQPSDDLLLQVHQGRPYIGLDPISGGGLRIRSLVIMAADAKMGEKRVLQALFSIAERQINLAERVQNEYTRYREISYLRTPLKYSFVLTLSLVLLVSLLAAVWGAFYSARRLVAPIQDLAAGTQAVARGEYDTRLPLPAKDEVGFLVLSFNEMTSRLAEAKEQASRSQQEVESERAYLEAMLANLSSGVIALDAGRNLRTANSAAQEILDVEFDRYLGKPLDKTAVGNAMMDQFLQASNGHFEAGETVWRDQFVLRGSAGRKVLMCSCTSLADEESEIAGYVIVFEDVTTLLQAQRDAAWGEVARRLAHEIKNPLTPIQLSAERLQQKCYDKLSGKDGEVLRRSTQTIIQQVQAMQSMVNAFSEYARTPELNLIRLKLNHLVAEVADLYRGKETGATFTVELDDNIPAIEADAGRMRQMLHNMIKNALEAVDGNPHPRVNIRTHLVRSQEAMTAEIVVEDNGPGFDPDILSHAFEPYVTSKSKGTGLGLAIVKKLAEEHGGKVFAENRSEGGARLVILLPLNEDAHAALLFERYASATRGGGRRAS